VTDKDRIRETVQNLLPETESFLCDIMRFPSTPGREQEEMEFLCGAFGALGADVEKAEMADDLLDDPDYCDPVPGLHYDGRFNLSVVRRGTGGGRTVVLNAHADVVPPSEGMDDAWNPRVENGVVFGRGACDAKGQVATVFLALRALENLGATLRGDVVAHLVVEEENGGNGTLAMVRRGVEADACIVLEPTGGKLMTSVRGAVWFRVALRGTAGHTAQASRSSSALLMARDAIAVLEKYHDDLLAASRGFPLFDPIANPMPINFGRLEAGSWPATVPSRAVLEGVLGLLPNKTKEQVCEEMNRALKEANNEFLAKNFELSFMYRHDSSVLDPEHELPQGLLKAADEIGASLGLGGMPASCDAWFYNNQLGIPTVVCGPGALGVAHSKDEQIDMQDIAKAAEVLVTFLIEYCGASE
jgi:acetylornithine deacetylase